MARLRACFARGLLVITFALSESAHAQPATDSTVEPGETPSEEARARALELFEQSKGHYDRGEFAAAAALLERAYATFPEPVLLYNLARSQQEAGEFEKALDAYERYLEADPDVKDRAGIEQRIATIREQLGADRKRPGDVTAASSPPPRSHASPTPIAPTRGEARSRTNRNGRSSVAPWLVAGVGVATVGAGAVLGLIANAHHDDAKAEPSALKARSEQAKAEDFALAANVAFAAGGILVAAGVSWGIIELASDDGATTRTSMKVSVGPASARWRMDF